MQAAHQLPTADIINVINLTNQPTTGAHTVPLSATGDVLRVDLGIASAFPCGRSINIGAKTGHNTEDAPVTDIELTLLISGSLGFI